ncbi:hypothetical protein N7468_001580 [Penicillium chermesinum]|uniref:Uncharacterized protein n=1 Tax=Penicillium chermesinum TaxID=63820 RepID=A0A9W9PJU1_9EURO|nr:uncharacterized protein N7468_001580 [Penicillium chermesinum]KAJ5246597.1 hypothetical protein N7468_001580 [Penicillium chermesinum]KAJ6144867.1 hypothetical protein N7470_008762 [Penicillium chermesinum]
MSPRHILAKELKALHKTYQPVILANIVDGVSMKVIASLPQCKAVATGNCAVAEAAGHLRRAVKVDARDGCGAQLASIAKELIETGVFGINLDDVDSETKKLHSKAEASNRIQEALQATKDSIVPHLAINTRCDVLLNGGKLDGTIERGKTYLLGLPLFSLGGSAPGRITQRVQADGRLNASKTSDGLAVAALSHRCFADQR